jgi:hypothetical protein
MLTPDTRRKRILQLANMKRHLSTREVLLKRPVSSTELVGLDETSAMKSKLDRFSAMPRNITVISFDDRTSGRFHDFLRRLSESNPAPVTVWSSHSVDCGCIISNSITNISFEYDFKQGDEGFVFTTTDLNDRLAVDCYEDDDGREVAEIVTQGKNWLRIGY